MFRVKHGESIQAGRLGARRGLPKGKGNPKPNSFCRRAKETVLGALAPGPFFAAAKRRGLEANCPPAKNISTQPPGFSEYGW